ncbi:type II toxin-antitoxin system PemK/MazF family toxin [Vagococcus fluvialis]|uniref:type II toxin-antitoxin system PemK/MazF family toxin n=1 Tax=Vagococcus fluvialis TaxID=2738 RepID=UPI003B20FF29
MEENIRRLCNIANNIFISESMSNYYKFKYLPQWLNSKGKYFQRERREFEQNKNLNFMTFKRSSLVYVDFGVNVGYELSGHHFAIILNKKDNPKNGVLSVIPISSKQKNNYVPVGSVIEDAAISIIVERAAVTFEKLLTVIHLSAEKKIVNLDILEKENDFLFELAIKNKMDEQTLRQNEKKYKLYFSDIDSLNMHMEKIQKEIESYEKIKTIYSKYNKNSFAMANNIQTISKRRIKRLDNLDLSGELRVPSYVMEEIDKTIISSFTK